VLTKTSMRIAHGGWKALVEALVEALGARRCAQRA
jgi:phytoene dehydrogenase-like protein